MKQNESGASIYAENELAKRRYEARVRARHRLCPHLCKKANETKDTNFADTIKNTAKDTNSANTQKSTANATPKDINSASAKDAPSPAKKFMLEDIKISKGELCPALAKYELILWDEFFFYKKCSLDDKYEPYNPQHNFVFSEFDFPKNQLIKAYEQIKADDVRVEPYSARIVCYILRPPWAAINDILITAQVQLKVIGKVIDAIYVLESECFRTHEALSRLANAISSLDNFEQNQARPVMHSFNRGMIFSTPVYESISRYYRKGYLPMGGIQTMSVEYDCTYKYELKHCNEGVLKQIKSLKSHLKECQAWANASAAWLEGLISQQKDFTPHQALDNPVPPDNVRAIFDYAMGEDERKKLLDEIAKKRAVIKRADYNKLTADEKKRLDEIIVKAKEIQHLITNNFAKDGKWIDTKSLIAAACGDDSSPSSFFRALGLD